VERCIIEGVAHARCGRCGAMHPETEFTPNGHYADGTVRKRKFSYGTSQCRAARRTPVQPQASSGELQ